MIRPRHRPAQKQRKEATSARHDTDLELVLVGVAVELAPDGGLEAIDQLVEVGRPAWHRGATGHMADQVDLEKNRKSQSCTLLAVQ